MGLGSFVGLPFAAAGAYILGHYPNRDDTPDPNIVGNVLLNWGTVLSIVCALACFVRTSRNGKLLSTKWTVVRLAPLSLIGLLGTLLWLAHSWPYVRSHYVAEMMNLDAPETIAVNTIVGEPHTCVVVHGG